MRTPKLLVLDDSDELYRQVEGATAALRPRPEVVACREFELVDAVLAEHGPFDVLIAGPIVQGEGGLRELRNIRVATPQTNLILAFDKWKSTSLRETVRTGAVDILRLPVGDEVLVEAVEQALQLRWALPLDVAAHDSDTRRDDKVIAVVSATGGCGKTFFSTNLAYHLQSQFQKRTCLIDLDLQFGELSTALRLKPRFTIADLLNPDESDDDLGHRLEEALARHDTGIQLLAAPDEPADADAIEAADVARIIDAAKSRFDYTVVDTPAALSEAVLVTLEHADQIFALATLDLPSVRNLGVLLSTFKQLKVPPERVHLVLNKVEPDVGMDIDRVTKYFPQGFSIVVPYGREANRSLNMGMPMLAYAPRSDAAKALTDGFGKALTVSGAGESAAGVGAAGRRRGLLGRRKRAA